RLIARRAFEASWMFVRRAGTLILASMIVIWALLYFPATNAEGQGYDLLLNEKEEARAELDGEIKALKAQANEQTEIDLNGQLKALTERSQHLDDEIHQLQHDWKRGSYLGRVGRWLEPAVRPLGWDWRIGMAALASFPAREVMVGTLGIIFQ